MDALLQDWRERALALEDQVKKALVGLDRVIRLVNIAIFARGHVLLEGDVGVGKTTLLRAIARTIGGAYERVDGTIDLMPNDLIYYTYINPQGKPRVDPGPLLRHGEGLSIFFFNEINRARPQVHSLMLRAMAERSVNAFNRDYRFPHLQVFADRNRLEKEETFELPSAARDRFMMEILVQAPEDPALQHRLMFDPGFHDTHALLARVEADVLSHTELNAIASRIQEAIRTTDTLERYALDLCRATRSPEAYGITLEGIDIDRLIQAGVSPRGMSMLLRAAKVAAWLRGGGAVIPEDLHGVFHETIAHRVFFTPVYELRRSQLASQFMEQILQRVVAP
jgi:MoxR-like ATPase